MLALRVLVALAGALVVFVAVFEAVRVFVLPRGASLRFSRWVFILVFRALRSFARLRGARQREERDAVMVYAAPLSVVSLPFVWLVASLIGYAGIFWAIEGGSFGNAVVISGSSLLTLGFDRPNGVVGAITSFSEALVGLALLAVVISYLPTLSAAFARREIVVAMLDARAGTPPDGVTLIERHLLFATVDHLDLQWPEWEKWIVDVGASHSTHPMLTFFRSADSSHSWVTATTALVDAANLRLSAIDRSGAGNAGAFMFYRAATGVLARIAAYFSLGSEGVPKPAIDRAEFDRALGRFEHSGVTLVDDRDLAWERFSRRRAEYEPLVSALTVLLDAPAAPWAVEPE